MRTTFIAGLMATSCMAAAGISFAQSDVAAGGKPGCVLAKATPTPSPTPSPSGGSGGGIMPKATLTARKTGGEQQDAAPAPDGNKKWGNVVLKRGADAADCPK